MSDAVNNPKHYNFGTVEVIDVIEDWRLGFHLGNALKYIARAPYKGNEVQDLNKALWYVRRYLKAPPVHSLRPYQVAYRFTEMMIIKDWILNEKYAQLVSNLYYYELNTLTMRLVNTNA